MLGFALLARKSMWLGLLTFSYFFNLNFYNLFTIFFYFFRPFTGNYEILLQAAGF
jgi:hypothetical protein